MPETLLDCDVSACHAVGSRELTLSDLAARMRLLLASMMHFPETMMGSCTFRPPWLSSPADPANSGDCEYCASCCTDWRRLFTWETLSCRSWSE